MLSSALSFIQNYPLQLIRNTLLIVFAGLSFALQAEPFVIAKLFGQLGNQLFQIAAATNVAIENHATPVFPDLINCQQYNIPLNYAKVFSHLNVNVNGQINFRYVEPNFPYAPIPYNPNMIIEGYFQSEKYFVKNKSRILQLFAPSKEIVEYLTSRYDEILNHPCTVAVHFRSYLQEDPHQRTHPTLTKQYFEKTIAYYPKDALFVVCSNDIEWCKTNFSTLPRNFVYIEGEPHYHDLYLMSMCKHNIISNSSFSWWSAYLNANPEKVVTAPRKWFTSESGIDYRDLIPADWIIMD